MKILVLIALLAVAACTSGAPTPGATADDVESRLVPVRLEDVDTDAGLNVHEVLVRHRRLTCDVGSIETAVVTPNHALCASKCILKGRAGGRCENQLCICRDDKWVPW